MDTRPAPDTVGPRSAPLGAADTHVVTAIGMSGDCTEVPTTASAVSLNVTAVGATAGTFLTVWATGSPLPTASSLNPQPGAPPAPNAVTTELNADGQFSIYNFLGSVNVIADINGYYVDHDHDDRYYTKPQVDATLGGLTGENVVDGSLSLSDLGDGATTTRTLVLSSPLNIPAGECRGTLTGNFGPSVIGKMVIATLADAGGNPVLPNAAALVPTIVIGTTQGGAVPNLLVCSTGSSLVTIPVGAVFTYRLING